MTKRKRIFYFCLLGVGIFFALYVLRLNVSVLIENSGWLSVRQVTVKGLEHGDRQKLVDLMKIGDKASLLSVDLDQIKKNIEEGNKQIKVTSIGTSFPDTIEVEVAEQKPDFILIVDKKNFYAIKSDMTILAKDRDIFYFDKPVLAVNSPFLESLESEDLGGFSQDKFSQDKKIDVPTPKIATEELIGRSVFLKMTVNALSSLKTPERDFLNAVSVVNLTKDTYAEIYVNDGPFKIVLDETFSQEDLRNARYAYLYRNSLQEKPSSVDIRSGLMKYRF